MSLRNDFCLGVVAVVSSIFMLIPGQSQAADWTYESYPYLINSTNDFLPRAIDLDGVQLEALFPQGAGTHPGLGVEQVYANHDLSKWVGVKKSVELPQSAQGKIGVWTPLADGAVLHLYYKQSVTAFFASGLSSQERYQLERTLRKTRQYVLWPNLFIQTAYAEEATTGVAQWQNQAGQLVQEGVSLIGLQMCVVKRSLQLMGTGLQTLFQEAKAGVTGFVEDANEWRKAPLKPIREGAQQAKEFAQEKWQELGDNINYVRENPQLVAIQSSIKVNNFVQDGQELFEKATDPDYILSKIKGGLAAVKIVMDTTMKQVSSAFKGFRELEPDVQRKLICMIGGYIHREILLIGASMGGAALVTALSGGAGAATFAPVMAKIAALGVSLARIAPALKKASDLYRVSRTFRNTLGDILDLDLATPGAIQKIAHKLKLAMEGAGDVHSVAYQAANNASKLLDSADGAIKNAGKVQEQIDRTTAYLERRRGPGEDSSEDSSDESAAAAGQ